MRRAIALVLLALLVPAPALGLTYREQRALDVAKAKWKRLPCAGMVMIERGQTDPTHMAEAQPPCTIVMNEDVDPTWAIYCTAIVHEVGHLLGYGHSPDPRSVMYPAPRNYWRCDHSPEWSLSHRK